MRILIQRFAYTPNYGTFGTLTCYDKKLLPLSLPPIYTVEKGWKGNSPDISCIPLGMYEAKLGDFQGKYKDLELLSVPMRTNIEIHRANRASELAGCIAPGLGLGVLKGHWAVTRSKEALDLIMEQVVPGERVLVDIVNLQSSMIAQHKTYYCI